jgi:foldase protein PrsA
MQPAMRHSRLNRLSLALLCLLCVGVGLTTVSCGEESSREVLATVDGKPITRGDLVKKLREARGPSVLLQMIDEKLIGQEAKAESLTVTPEQLKNRMDQAEASAGSRKDLEAKLQQRGISLEAFQQELTYDIYLSQIIRQQMKITDEDVQAYYKQHAKDFKRGDRVRARMMLLDTRENADAVSTALSAGGDFAGLAKSFSTDPATGPNGGDMGTIERKDFNAAITEVAFAQRDGQISKPFKVPDGWCIVQTQQHIAGGLLPLAQVKTEIEGRIQRDRQDAVRQEWLNKQRTSAKLSIRDKFLGDEVKQLIAGKVPLKLGQP